MSCEVVLFDCFCGCKKWYFPEAYLQHIFDNAAKRFGWNEETKKSYYDSALPIYRDNIRKSEATK